MTTADSRLRAGGKEIRVDHRLEDEVRAALAAAGAEDASPIERAEMLMEIAIGLQQRPKSPAHLDAAVDLYARALSLCPPAETLLAARIGARRATALQALPQGGVPALEEAR